MPGLMQNAPKAALNHDLQWLSYANNVYLCNNNAEINLKLQHPSLVCELLKISFFKSSPPPPWGKDCVQMPYPILL